MLALVWPGAVMPSAPWFSPKTVVGPKPTSPAILRDVLVLRPMEVVVVAGGDEAVDLDHVEEFGGRGAGAGAAQLVLDPRLLDQLLLLLDLLLGRLELVVGGLQLVLEIGHPLLHLLELLCDLVRERGRRSRQQDDRHRDEELPARLHCDTPLQVRLPIPVSQRDRFPRGPNRARFESEPVLQFRGPSAPPPEREVDTATRRRGWIKRCVETASCRERHTPATDPHRCALQRGKIACGLPHLNW